MSHPAYRASSKLCMKNECALTQGCNNTTHPCIPSWSNASTTAAHHVQVTTSNCPEVHDRHVHFRALS